MTYPDDAERLDPDAEGLPSVADDTSSAYDNSRSRTREDTAPALPRDQPQGFGDFEATQAEAEDVDDSFGSIDLNEPPPRRIGRLVDPSAGGLTDDEPQAIATDTGESLGLSAEEAAMHEVNVDDEEEGND